MYLLSLTQNCTCLAAAIILLTRELLQFAEDSAKSAVCGT